MAPHTFFQELIPAVLATSPRSEGTFRITVFNGRRRDWTVDLAQGTVEFGATRAVDLDLELDERDLVALLAGKLDWDRAILAGRIRYRGALSVLLRFAELLNTVN